ncbi:MAG: TIGR02147 family protein, partial [Bdellovibrionota bacterium]
MQKLDFRHFIKQVYSQRCEKNPKYSMRSFAKDLGLSPQMLNSIFNRGSGLSRSRALEVAKNLNLSESDEELFLTLIEASHQRSSMGRKAAREKLEVLKEQNSTMEELKVEEFRNVAGWKEIAALCLVDLEDFKTDFKWI